MPSHADCLALTQNRLEEERKEFFKKFEPGHERDLEELFYRIYPLGKNDRAVLKRICSHRQILEEIQKTIGGGKLPIHGSYESWITSGLRQNLEYVVRFDIDLLSQSEIHDWFACYRGEGSLPDYCKDATPSETRLWLMEAFWKNKQTSDALLAKAKYDADQQRFRDTVQWIIHT